MFNWFKKKDAPSLSHPLADMHSHLLPGLDDGVKSFEEAIAILQFFERLGYKKVITTPHVMADIYRNSTETILESLALLRDRAHYHGINIELSAAAEYYLDEQLLSRVINNEALLTFGHRYLLFETSFLTQPLNMSHFIFEAASRGYKLVLAHPERYLYLHGNLAMAEDLLHRGVLFQINISSITGYYSKPAQQMAYKLIDRGWVHLLGSDCHHMMHAELLVAARKNKYYQKALTLPLLNNSLL